MTKSKTINNQWIFIDESGKPEVYSSQSENLIEKLLCYDSLKQNENPNPTWVVGFVLEPINSRTLAGIAP